MITYWIRVHCHWVRVTTSLQVWGTTPRAMLDIACTVLAGGLGYMPALPTREAPVLPFTADYGSGFSYPTESMLYAPSSVIMPSTPVPVPECGSAWLLAVGVIVIAAMRWWTSRRQSVRDGRVASGMAAVSPAVSDATGTPDIIVPGVVQIYTSE